MNINGLKISEETDTKCLPRVTYGEHGKEPGLQESSICTSDLSNWLVFQKGELLL